MGTVKLVENAVAISGGFHSDKAYRKFYDKHGPEFEGFPGIWRFVARAARIFTKVEEDWKTYPWAKHNWIDAVDRFVIRLYTCDSTTTDKELRYMARDSITES